MESRDLAPRVFTMQVIAGALLAGVVSLTAVAVFMVQHNGGEGLSPQDPPVLTLLAAVMLVVNAPLSFALPNVMLKRAVHGISASAMSPRWANEYPDTRSDDEKLLGARQTALIISLALLEGAGFLAAIAYLLEGQVYALGLVLVAVALMAWNFPTVTGVQSWLDRHRSLVNELKTLGDEPRL